MGGDSAPPTPASRARCPVQPRVPQWVPRIGPSLPGALDNLARRLPYGSAATKGGQPPEVVGCMLALFTGRMGKGSCAAKVPVAVGCLEGGPASGRSCTPSRMCGVSIGWPKPVRSRRRAGRLRTVCRSSGRWRRRGASARRDPISGGVVRWRLRALRFRGRPAGAVPWRRSHARRRRRPGRPGRFTLNGLRSWPGPTRRGRDGRCRPARRRKRTR